jgi:hypothetical protein
MKWVCLLYFLFNIYDFQIDFCQEFEKESSKKLNLISAKLQEFNKPNYLNKKDLFSIVSPEFVTFSETANRLELLLVKTNLRINNSKMDLSFGPFQMKLSFIRKIVSKTPSKILNDPFLQRIKRNRFNLSNPDVDTLNQIKTQWNILRAFEYVNKEVYKKYSIAGLCSLYNSGQANKNVVYTKIKCKDLSYSEWCIEFNDHLINKHNTN